MSPENIDDNDIYQTLVWAARARHVLTSTLNSDIRSSIEPTIAFTHNINPTSTINFN